MPLQFYRKKKLKFIFVIFWVLLTYIVAALIWWFIALNDQNNRMAQYRVDMISHDNPHYTSAVENIRDIEKRKTAQYLGEGITFLLLIIAGAVFIYRAVRKQLRSGIEQQNFMMAITHELKTPIAVTKLNLETLLRHNLDGEQQKKLLNNTIQEANRLNALCNNLLLVSQIEGGAYKITKEEIVLSDILDISVQDFKTRFPQRIILSDIDTNVSINGDELLLQLAINNLIDNAIKYTPKETEVTVSLKRSGKNIRLSVSDHGKGIGQKEKKKIFEKYYRTGNEATRGAKGTGLGLYLTKKIATQHKANIFVEDNVPSGSIFIIEFA